MASEILSTPIAQLVIYVAVLAVLVAVGVYLKGKLRAGSAHQDPTASELMTKFRKLHSQGDLSDKEFREIKVTLAERMESELRDTDQTG